MAQLEITHHIKYKIKSDNPFCDGRFFQLLEESHSVGDETGWLPYHLKYQQDILPGYLKGHSYGEYIFDWAWADFYQRYRIPYYPKLIHAIPFTPVNAPKNLTQSADIFSELVAHSFENYQRTTQLSGEHYLFLTDDEAKIIESQGHKIMKSTQYHWQKKWDNFEHFLQSLKKGRRKMIKKERQKVKDSGIRIKTYRAHECLEIMPKVYELYLSTIAKKNSYAYLKKEFFQLLPKMMDESLLIFIAEYNSQDIAMSLFIDSEKALYGRYWGILAQYENEFPALHFEMCYYQGMDYCFKNDIPLFEAGAQGEHKLWRGFEPVEILSAHHLRIPELFKPICDYIDQQNQEVENRILELRKYLPYKS